MPMKREDHENLLNELLNTEIDHTRRTEILQELRTDYAGVHGDFEDMTKNNEKLSKDNGDLVTANSQLFRQLGVVGGNQQQQEEAKEKEFSETITISQLEKE
jgi:ABC-type transporter Mla subunit MlaD